jgi:hypothetical protein
MKNRYLAIFLSIVPGFGHLYLGLYKKAIKYFLFFIGVFFAYILIIGTFRIGSDSFGDFWSEIFYLPLVLSYFASMGGAYYDSDKINQKIYIINTVK